MITRILAVLAFLTLFVSSATATERPFATRVEYGPEGRVASVVNFPGGPSDTQEFDRLHVPAHTVAIVVFHNKKGEANTGVRCSVLQTSGKASWGTIKEGQLDIDWTYDPEVSRPSPQVPSTPLTLVEAWDYLKQLAPVSLEVDFNPQGEPTRAYVVGVGDQQPNLEPVLQSFKGLKLPKGWQTSSVVFYGRNHDGFRGVAYGRDGMLRQCSWDYKGFLTAAEVGKNLLQDPLLFRLDSRETHDNMADPGLTREAARAKAEAEGAVLVVVAKWVGIVAAASIVGFLLVAGLAAAFGKTDEIIPRRFRRADPSLN